MQTDKKSYFLIFLNKNKWFVIATMILTIIGAVSEILLHYSIKEIIDAIVQNQNQMLWGLLIIYGVYNTTLHGSFFVIRLFGIHYRPKILQENFLYFYERITKHSLSWFESKLSGDIAAKITDFHHSIVRFLDIFPMLISSMFTIVLSIYFVVQIYWPCALIIGAYIVLYTPLMGFLIINLSQYEQDYSESKQHAVGKVNDTISNITAVKVVSSISYVLSSIVMPKLINMKQNAKKVLTYEAFAIDLVDTVFSIVANLTQIIILAKVFSLGLVSAGSFAFVMGNTLYIRKTLERIIETVAFGVIPAYANYKVVADLLNEPVTVSDKQDAIELDRIKGDIKFEDVKISYGKRVVIKDFNLTINAGEKVGIVGISGAGKSTLIKSILRYFDVQSGSIKIDDVDIKDTTQDSLRKNVSIIPQEIALFHQTVSENIGVANPNATIKEIEHACKIAHVHEDILKLEHGYDTIVGERGIKLSGGQKQRIAIARAVLKKAPILILDEATSSLDSPTEQNIQLALNDFLAQNKFTVIAIAHRLSTLKNLDKIIVIEHGKIVEQGTHKELINKPDSAYKKLWDLQVF